VYTHGHQVKVVGYSVSVNVQLGLLPLLAVFNQSYFCRFWTVATVFWQEKFTSIAFQGACKQNFFLIMEVLAIDWYRSFFSLV